MKMWPQLFQNILFLSLFCKFSIVSAGRESFSENLLRAVLNDDESPPIPTSDEDSGTIILGKGAVNPSSTLDCHTRLYSYKVTKTDSKGKTCWDMVNVMSCWGRCDSNEIPDWRFPFKKSYHPVCLFGSKKPVTHILKNCEEDTEPGTERYDFQEAETCICSVCKSSETSCEGLRYRGIRSGLVYV